MAGRRVVVEAPSRLHFGIVDPFKKQGRRFISAGVAIDYPRTRVVVEPCRDLEVVGCRASEVYEKINVLRTIYGDLRGRVIIEACTPRHVGLGSTTQLLLAASTGLLYANNIHVDIVEVARSLGLGKISGVGTYVFIHGGFIVDTGVYGENYFPKLMTRLEIPREWAFIIITPRGEGLDEKRESEIFSSEFETPRDLPWRASYTLLTRLIPAIIDRDFQEFSHALRELQEVVGEMFSVFQGGVFNVKSAKYIDLLTKMGIIGVGQSSWGPTVYGVVESMEKALVLEAKLRELVDQDALILTTSPRNKGAEVTIDSP